MLLDHQFTDAPKNTLPETNIRPPRCHGAIVSWRIPGAKYRDSMWRLTPKHEPLEVEDQNESMSLTWNSGATEKWQVACVMCNYILHEYPDLMECIQVELKLWIGLCRPTGRSLWLLQSRDSSQVDSWYFVVQRLGINPRFVSLRKSENSISIANYVNDPSSGGTIQPVRDWFMCDRFVLAHLRTVVAWHCPW